METFLTSYTLKGNPLGPTLLFLHGFLGCKNDWSDTVDYLQPDYQTLVIDLPGHGDALFEDPHCYSMDICAANIVALIQKLGLSTVYLVGYSMGGRIALYLGVHYPHIFQKILMISASPGIENQLERERRLEADLALAKVLEKEDFRVFLENWYGQGIFSSLKNQNKLREALIFKRGRNSPRHLAMALTSLSVGRQQPLWQHLSGIQVPIDLIAGALDPKFVAIGERMCSYQPEKIKLHKIKNAGHMVHLESFLRLNFQNAKGPPFKPK